MALPILSPESAGQHNPSNRSQVSESVNPAAAVLFPRGHSARITDAILVGLLVVRFPAPVIHQPVPQLAIAALLALAVFRRPVRTLPAWYLLGATCAFGYLVIESLVNDVSPWKRAASIGALMIMAGFIGSGRIDPGSAIKGFASAIVVNAALFYAHVAPNNYSGDLTGFLQDKNAAGLSCGAAALLLVAVVPPRATWLRLAALAGGGLLVVLTDSRTTMAAYALAVIWLLVSPVLRGVAKLPLLAAVIGAFWWADGHLAEAGRYAIERAGSDALRHRIDAASWAKVMAAHWYGDGLGAASVDLDGEQWFFHNAFYALLAEGGVLALVLVLAGYVLAGFDPGRPAARFDPRHAVAAATLLAGMCATRLGEVFFAPVGGLIVGIGLAVQAASRRPPDQPFGTATPSPASVVASAAAPVSGE